jgi:CpeS-like protein
MTLIPPMTMMDFFRKSEGTWLTLRAVHHFDLVDDESGESNLIIQVVAQDDPKVVTICEQQSINPAQAMGGGRFMWQANLDDIPPNEDYGAVLIDVPDDETKRSGKLIRDRGYVEKIPVISRYWFGQDGILTIDTEYDNNQGQERCWFINDDFRIRVSSVRTMDGVNLTTYCSERRCISDDSLAKMIDRNLARVGV